MNTTRRAMPVTRKTAAAGAALLIFANMLFVGIAGGGWSKFVYGLLALVALFPIDRLAGLWRLLTDKRPSPAYFGTAATLDPREGHPELPELHLIGRVIERRKL